MKIGFPLSESSTQFFINQVYPEFIANAEFEPIPITPANNIEAMVELCDGLLLPGGKDLEPTYYGDENTYSLSVDPKKDAFERALLYAFKDAKKPIFGICRGFQLIVREFMVLHELKGFEYSQGITGHSVASARDMDRNIPTHRVTADKDCLYGRGGVEDMFVNSIHHQGLLAYSKEPIMTFDKSVFTVVAKTKFSVSSTAKHSIVEGVDIKWDGVSIRGVQWHPEELNDVPIIQNFFINNQL